MTTKTEIIDTHIAHPDWDAQAIAKHLGANDGHVRKVIGRAGLQVPSKFLRRHVEMPPQAFRKFPFAGKDGR